MRIRTVLLILFILFQSNVVLSASPDQGCAIKFLGDLARTVIPKEKPGRLRAYLLPVAQKEKQSINDLTEALRTEKGRNGYFALLSCDQESLVATILEVLPKIEKNSLCKLTVIFVGYKQHQNTVFNAFSHTGATFVFKEMD